MAVTKEGGGRWRRCRCTVATSTAVGSRPSAAGHRPAPPSPRARFRRRLRSRSHAVTCLAQAVSPSSSPTSRLSADGAAEPAGQAEEVGEEEEEQQQGQDEEEEEDEQEEGAVEDVDLDGAGEVVVGGDDADGNGDAEGGQGESEGFDPNPEASYLDGIEERKRELNDKLDTLNKKKHDLVQMLKQVLNAEEEIRMRRMQALLRATMPQPSENAADGSSVSRQAPGMTVDVNFGEVAGE